MQIDYRDNRALRKYIKQLEQYIKQLNKENEKLKDEVIEKLGEYEELREKVLSENDKEKESDENEEL